MPHEYEDTNSTDLKKNIGYIIAKNAVDNAIPHKSMEQFLIRITKNFYSEIGRTISNECVHLYRKTGDRELTHSFLLIAYDSEMQWLVHNVKKIFIDILTNPHSFERIHFGDLGWMDTKLEKEIKHRLQKLLYKDYLRTPYWKSVRSEVLRMYGYACVRCGSTKELNVHHMKYDYIGEDHKHINNLVCLCEQHHLEWHMLHDVPYPESGTKWQNVVTQKYKK